MKKRIASIFALLTMALLFACGGESKLGEDCDDTGKTDGVCESGSVCGKNTSDTLVCLKQCDEQSDCAAGEECNGVEGSSVKGCRLKTDSTGTKK